MTVSSLITSKQYTSNGATLQYAFPNKIFAATDLVVTLIDLVGTVYPFTNFANATTGLSYSVQGVDVDTGCTVVFSAVQTSGWTIDIRTVTADTQSTSIKNQGQFLPELHEEAFDRTTRQIQDLLRLAYTYGIHGPDIEVTPWPALPIASGRKGYALMFDAFTGLPGLGFLSAQNVTAGLIGGVLYPPVAAEGGTVVNVFIPYGWVTRYGAIGNGSTDDSAAFAAAAAVSGIYPMLIPWTAGGYKITSPFVLPANATMQGIGLGRPQLFATANGSHICSGVAGGPITISNIRFLGSNATTPPSFNFGGFSSQSTGLVAIANCTDVRVVDCEFSTFYNCLSVNGCTRVWIHRNWTFNCLSTGILCGSTTRFEIEFNDIDNNSVQTGAAVAYGVQCTGNQAGSAPAQYNSVSFNRIRNIPSWDAIGTHDIDGLRVIGNDCRNVRHGIDIGHLVNTNVVENVVVANNYIESTGIDTFAGAGQEIGAILIAGFDATHRVLGATVTGNLIRGFFNVNGMVGAGNGAGCICIANTDDANVTGNAITGGGTGNTPQSTGIFIAGTVNRLTVSSNSVQGQSYPRGAIRLQNVTADIVTITGNSGLQTTSSNNHLLITGSTISALAIDNNPTNSVAPISIVTSTYTMAGPRASRVAVTVPYSASMSFEAGLGNIFEITATNGTAFSISNPLDPVIGQRITLRIINASGGALGAVTFGTQFKMSAWTQPANGNSRSVDLEYNGTNWYQVSQTGVDIPN